MLTFYPSRIPEPWVKKAPESGSGSATLIVITLKSVINVVFRILITKVDRSQSWD
jgi:hypothetical protein